MFSFARQMKRWVAGPSGHNGFKQLYFRNSLFSAEFMLWQKLCQLYQHFSDSACRHRKRTLDGPHKKIRAMRSCCLSPRIPSVFSR